MRIWKVETCVVAFQLLNPVPINPRYHPLLLSSSSSSSSYLHYPNPRIQQQQQQQQGYLQKIKVIMNNSNHPNNFLQDNHHDNNNNHDEDDDDDDDEDEKIKPYRSRSKTWTTNYKSLIPYEKAKKSVHQLGLRSKAEWDEYVSDGKPYHGPYLPSKPDEMYASEWENWDEFLGIIRSYNETKGIVQNVLKIKGRLEYELFVYSYPKRAEGLRIPALPWVVYDGDGWMSDEDFFGIV